METILRKSLEKVLRLFYKDKSQKYHLREISRKTNLNENSVTRVLKSLEEKKLIQYQRTGNLKQYFIQRNEKSYYFFGLFDLEKYLDLPQERKDCIQIFLSKLKKRPLISILFGSSAKGNFTKESDLDLLIITNEKTKTEESLDYAESQTGIQINCIQLTFEEFLQEIKLKEDKTIEAAIQTGYPLENRELFYKTILNEN